MKYALFLLFVLTINVSCKKYLDKIPNIGLAVPRSLNDFQYLMDREAIYNQAIPQVGDLGSDDYYIDSSVYGSSNLVVKNSYSWNSQIWDPTLVPFDWSAPYTSIYYCNVVIDGLKDYQVSSIEEEERKGRIYGHALFVRALMHYSLQEIFGQPYRPSSAATDLGIPLKITSNLADMPSRSSVQSVFERIISDLKEAAVLLPESVPVAVRPSKAAAFALLSRVYLTEQDYAASGRFADSSLSRYKYLHDFNSLPTSGNNPFAGYPAPSIFPEVLYMANSTGYPPFRTSASTTKIDSTLFRSYDSNDLRKLIYFQKNSTVIPNTYYLKTHYSNNANLRFAGIAVDEVYLIRAESYARLGNKDSALSYLNTLLKTRWKTGKFVDYEAINVGEALVKILFERRKELVFRTIRWTDLRRLNQIPEFQITLKRKLGIQEFHLDPNDRKYTYPIPDKEIRLNELSQNPR